MKIVRAITLIFSIGNVLAGIICGNYFAAAGWFCSAGHLWLLIISKETTL